MPGTLKTPPLYSVSTLDVLGVSCRFLVLQAPCGLVSAVVTLSCVTSDLRTSNHNPLELVTVEPRTIILFAHTHLLLPSLRTSVVIAWAKPNSNPNADHDPSLRISVATAWVPPTSPMR